MAEQVVWTTTPPASRLSTAIGLLALEPGESVVCRKLGPVWWTTCHWDGERNIICTGETCRIHDKPITQRGFVAVESDGRSWRGKSPGPHLSVLPVTLETAESVGVCASGSLFTVSRLPGNRKLPLRIEPIDRKARTPCPAEFDPRPFALRAMQGGQKNICKFQKRA